MRALDRGHRARQWLALASGGFWAILTSPAWSRTPPRTRGRGVNHLAALGPAGEAVDVEVEEELEALVLVDHRELVGQRDHVRELRHRQRRDVVAHRVRHGVGWGLVGGRLAALAGLVDREAV